MQSPIKQILVMAFVGFFAFSAVEAMTVEPVNPEQVLANAEMIVVGTIIKIETSWSGAGESMIATEYSIRLDRILHNPYSILNARSAGETIQLRFAGGTIGDKTVMIPGVPEYELNEQALFFIDGDELVSISPLVGVFAGDYRISQEIGYKGMVTDFSGALVTRAFFSLQNSARGGFTLDQFEEEIIRALPYAKANPDLILNQVVDIPDELKDLVFTGDQIPLATPILNQNRPLKSNVSLPSVSSASPVEVPVPVHEHLMEQGSDDQDQLSSPNADRYAFLWGPPDATSDFNIPPIYYSGAQWGLTYEFSLVDWNRYADLFRIYTSADNTFGHQGRNDFAFTDLTTFQATYGFSLPTTILGIAVMYNSAGDLIDDGEQIFEADVILNVAKSWTLDWATGYNNCSVWYFRSTVIHELGHCFGREHQFTADPGALYHSVMNYPPCGALDTEFWLPFVDDPQSIRAAYPALATTISDLGLHLFRTAGGGGIGIPVVWSTFSSSVVTGSSFSMSNFIIENLGTTAMTPTIAWYLTPSQQSYSGSHYLATTTHANLGTFAYWNTSRSIAVPSTIPAGDYYIAGALQSDDYNWNRSAWTNTKITVTCCALRGDVDHSGTRDVTDLTYLVDYLFRGGPPPPCEAESDVDGSGTVDITDLTYIVDWLFRGGPPPPPC